LEGLLKDVAVELKRNIDQRDMVTQHLRMETAKYENKTSREIGNLKWEADQKERDLETTKRLSEKEQQRLLAQNAAEAQQLQNLQTLLPVLTGNQVSNGALVVVPQQQRKAPVVQTSAPAPIPQPQQPAPQPPAPAPVGINQPVGVVGVQAGNPVVYDMAGMDPLCEICMIVFFVYAALACWNAYGKWWTGFAATVTYLYHRNRCQAAARYYMQLAIMLWEVLYQIWDFLFGPPSYLR
jgi:hypothetical protein